MIYMASLIQLMYLKLRLRNYISHTKYQKLSSNVNQIWGDDRSVSGSLRGPQEARSFLSGLPPTAK